MIPIPFKDRHRGAHLCKNQLCFSLGYFIAIGHIKGPSRRLFSYCHQHSLMDQEFSSSQSISPKAIIYRLLRILSSKVESPNLSFYRGRPFFVRNPSQSLQRKCGTRQFWRFENEFQLFENEFHYF